MPTVIVKTQAEIDALPAKFEVYTTIEIRGGTTLDRLVIRARRGNSSVVARGNSSVVARGNSSVVARENSSVEAWGNSSVVARGNSSVVARENSSVEAWENSSVVAWGNSSVVARENSSVVAWGNSSVVARENSSVEAYEFSMIAVLAATVVLKRLRDYCMVSLRGVKPKIGKKDKTVTVKKTPAAMNYTKVMFAERAESDAKGHVVLYKSVNPKNGCDYQTGKIKYEGIVECPDWDADPKRQCGGGLHLSPSKGAALSYHRGKVLKCRVALKDLVVYAPDITKVRCKRVEVLGPA